MRALRTAILTVFVSALLAGCVEERVVHRRPMLAGLPGAETGGVVTPPRVRGSGLSGGRSVEPRVVDEQGEVVLRSTTMQHLVTHLRQTLVDEERELFETYVLSDRTKREFAEAGRDVTQVYDVLRGNLRDLLLLLSQFPGGEFTPGIRMQKLGNRVYRLEVPPLLRGNLRWSRLDAVLEGGEFRFYWVW